MKHYRAYKKNKYIKSLSERDPEKVEHEKIKLNLNDLQAYIYVSNEKRKEDFDTNIRDEYMEKVLLFGYVMVCPPCIIGHKIKIFLCFLKLFSASFTLGPIILFLIILFDIRVDAKRLLWIYRRPVAYQAQNIGNFLL